MNTLRKMFSNRADKVLLGLFIFMMLWLTALQILGLKFTIYNYLDQVIMSFIPTVGGIVGLIRTAQWGGIRSKVGGIVCFISLGLLIWGVGQWIWTYYNLFLNVEIPYPSWADAGYAPAYLFWGLGIIMLANLTSIKLNSRPVERIFFFCIPLLMTIVTYYIIYVELHSGEDFLDADKPLKLFFDMYYPLADVCILTILVMSASLELNFLGRRLRLPTVIIIGGLISMYVADFSFSYTTSVESYYVGATADWLFAVAMFILSLGVSNLHPKLLEDRE